MATKWTLAQKTSRATIALAAVATFAVWFELWASQDCSDDPKRYLLDHRYVPLGLGIGSLLLAVAAWRMVPFADRRRIDLVLVTITTVAALILFLVVGARDFGHGPPGHTFCGGRSRPWFLWLLGYELTTPRARLIRITFS